MICLHGHDKSVGLCHCPATGCQLNTVVIFKILMAVNIITVFWDVMSYNLVDR